MGPEMSPCRRDDRPNVTPQQASKHDCHDHPVPPDARPQLGEVRLHMQHADHLSAHAECVWRLSVFRPQR